MKRLILCLVSTIFAISQVFGAENEESMAVSLGGLQGPGFSLGLKVGAGALSSSVKNKGSYYYGADSSHLIALETQYRRGQDWSYGAGVETVIIHGDTESSILLFRPKVSRTLPWQIGEETRWSLGLELGAGIANQFNGSTRLTKGEAYRVKVSLDWEILGNIPIFFLPGPIITIDTDKSFGYSFALSVSHTRIQSIRIYKPASQLSKSDQGATELMLEFGILYKRDLLR